jgi:hypothetical protein
LHRADQARHERHADSRGAVRPADGHDPQAVRSPTGDHPHIRHAWVATTMRYVHVHRSRIEDAWIAGQRRAATRLEGLV